MAQPYINPAPGFSLSQEDVARLLTEPSASSRIEVLGRVAQGYDSFNERELAIAEQIFRLLVHDTEISVRAALALALKDSAEIPRDIIIDLARDVVDVAVPLIKSSDVLSDADLLNIIRRSGDLGRLLAIAQRRRISNMVSSELIDTGETQVISTLVKNTGAQISDRGFQTIVTDFSDHPSVVEALVGRGDLPATVVEKLISTVTGSLAAKLQEKYQVSAPQFRGETDKTRELATLRLVESNPDPLEVDKLVSQLYAFGRLTPSIILTSLCRGNLIFFETSLAKLAGIPVSNARKLIGDRGGLGFKALYGKSGLPDSIFNAARLVLDVVLEFAAEGSRPGGIHYANRLVERILSRAEGSNVENLSYIIALIRQNSIA